jgi:hypothetical protein
VAGDHAMDGHGPFTVVADPAAAEWAGERQKAVVQGLPGSVFWRTVPPASPELSGPGFGEFVKSGIFGLK